MVHDVLEKEGKIVDLMFSKEVSELLKELKGYRTEHDIEDGGYVFVGTKINGAWMPITSSTAGDWCKKIGEMIDEPTLHPHDFRHSGATLLKNAGMSLEDVSSLLNHAGTDVTNKYYIKKDTTKIQSAKDRFEI
jgi:integrase